MTIYLFIIQYILFDTYKTLINKVKKFSNQQETQSNDMKTKKMYNIFLMNYLQNLQLIKNIAKEIIKPRSYSYSEEMVTEYLKEFSHIVYEKVKVTNISNESLKASLFINHHKEDLCILFMHGLGSTRLEGLNLLKQLPNGTSLCLFDFSGSGKSEGDKVTYGCKEKQDIEAILRYLRKCNYKKFVLWGRSMGAVSALLHSMAYQPIDVILLILDSPFSSFESITRQLAAQKTSIPNFLLNILLDLLKSNFKQLQHNPFDIDVTNCQTCRVPALFIYSESDEVVSYEHSLRIITNFKAKYDKIIIKENHNAPRNRQTLKKIFNNIDFYSKNQNYQPLRKSIFEDEITKKNRGINVLSRDKKIVIMRPGSSHTRMMNIPCSEQSTESQYFVGSTNKKLTTYSKKKKSPPIRKINSFLYQQDTKPKQITRFLSNRLYL